MRGGETSRSTKAPAAVAERHTAVTRRRPTARQLARFAVRDWREAWARDLLTLPTWSAPLAFWAEPIVPVRIGRSYEIPGNGNDRFFARLTARYYDGRLRMIITEPRRWCGFETAVAHGELRADRRARSNDEPAAITWDVAA